MDNPVPYTRHRCDQWQDIRIHPQHEWFWGTCMAHYAPRPETDGWIKDGGWTILDEQSGTLSLWNRPDCPFCHVALETFLHA